MQTVTTSFLPFQPRRSTEHRERKACPQVRRTRHRRHEGRRQGQQEPIARRLSIGNKKKDFLV